MGWNAGLGRIIGHATDPELAELLHDLDHRGCVEVLTVSGSDIARHRLQASTDRGTRCEIVVPRTQRLANGSVLLLDADRAVVVHLAEQQYLALAPQSPAAALELGYFAGNMHWPVLFRGAVLCILMQGPEESYLERLQPMLQDGRIRRVEMPHG